MHASVIPTPTQTSQCHLHAYSNFSVSFTRLNKRLSVIPTPAQTSQCHPHAYSNFSLRLLSMMCKEGFSKDHAASCHATSTGISALLYYYCRCSGERILRNIMLMLASVVRLECKPIITILLEAGRNLLVFAILNHALTPHLTSTKTVRRVRRCGQVKSERGKMGSGG